MVIKKTWKEFQDSGLLWFVNMIIHTFGWSIVYNIDDNNQITNVYPARVQFRGFNSNDNAQGYKKITEYLSDNVEKLKKDFSE